MLFYCIIVLVNHVSYCGPSELLEGVIVPDVRTDSNMQYLPPDTLEEFSLLEMFRSSSFYYLLFITLT